MSSVEWKRAQALYHEALERPEAERRTFLDAACGDDHSLRAEVEGLLSAREQREGFLGGSGEDVTRNIVSSLERLAGNAADLSPAEPLGLSSGQRIGSYKLLQSIGEGGFGSVWMAEQEHPVRRNVALKVIKLGMDTKEVIARFEAERQALAMMDHPNIAKVLDAGVTPSGCPYFAMELVKGVPITGFCDQERLSISERLDLFIPVCQAIQHAHQKGVIHRDLKPSNVLVALYDGTPVPKVIDFGVAKATGKRLTDKTLFTEFGAVIGTLEYMSPEQAELNQLDVDTRSDIYSLGVLLYELLTGTTPLKTEAIRQAAFGEVLRRIREEEPPKPSTRLSESREALPSISAQRKLAPIQVAKQVRGDLDWIVMRALEKSRTRRYPSASELAADLRRHLGDEPVAAGPPGAAYRLRKFVRKNRVSVLAAVAILLSLCVGLGISLASYAAARRSAHLAELRRAEAETALAEARRQTYRANLGAAAVSIEHGNLPEARRYLEACPEELRGWEWGHLNVKASGDGVDVVELEEPFFFRMAGSRIYSAPWSPDGRWIAAGLHEFCRIRDAQNGEVLATMVGHTGMVSSLAICPTGRHVASGSEDRTIRIWDPETGEQVSLLRGHDGTVTAVTFCPDGKHVISGSSDHTVGVWDLESMGLVHLLYGHEKEVTAIALSPDGKLVASGSQDSTIRIWDPESGRPLEVLRGHESAVTAVVFAPGGQVGKALRLLSGSADGEVRVWDPDTGEHLKSLSNPGKPGEAVRVLALNPDGTRLVLRTGKTLSIWDARTWEFLVALERGASEGQVTFSPDGKRIASASFLRILESEAASGAQLKREQELRRPVYEFLEGVFKEHVVHTAVIEALESDPKLDPGFRKRAIRLARAIRSPSGSDLCLASDVVESLTAPRAEYERALRWAEVACRLLPDNPACLNVLGIAQYRLARFQDALSTFRRARELPIRRESRLVYARGTDLLYMAMCLSRLEQPEKAREVLGQAREAVESPEGALHAVKDSDWRDYVSALGEALATLEADHGEDVDDVLASIEIQAPRSRSYQDSLWARQFVEIRQFPSLAGEGCDAAKLPKLVLLARMARALFRLRSEFPEARKLVERMTNDYRGKLERATAADRKAMELAPKEDR